MRTRKEFPTLANREFSIVRSAIGGWALGGYGTVHEMITSPLPSVPDVVGLGSSINFLEGDNARMLDFSGNATSDRVNLGNVPTGNLLQGGFPFAILCRVYLNNTAGSSAFWRVIDKSSAGPATNGWGFWFERGLDHFRFSIAGSTRDSNNSVSRGWRNVIFTATSSSFQYYIDGVAFGNGSHTDTFPNVATNMAIGNWNHSTDREWNGMIDYVVVSRGLVISNAEAQLLTTPGNEYLIFRTSPDIFYPSFYTSAAPTNRRMFHSARRP